MSADDVERPGSPTPDDDRTARARIRDAAIARFGADGVAATSLRAVAADAGVSPALVVHHFGSKKELRLACDRHVAATIRDRKSAAMAAGPGLDLFAVLRESEDSRPLMRYLARVLVESTPQVDALVDEIVADAVAYTQEGVRTGLLTSSRDTHGRAALLTLWSLGALVLHEHARRLLGADLLGGPAGQAPYSAVATEVLGEGVLTPRTAALAREAFERLAAQRPAPAPDVARSAPQQSDVARSARRQSDVARSVPQQSDAAPSAPDPPDDARVAPHRPDLPHPTPPAPRPPALDDPQSDLAKDLTT